MPFCTKCGNQMDDDATFCSKCGEPAAAKAQENAQESAQENTDNTAGSQNTYANDAYQNVKGKMETVLNTKDHTGEYDKNEIESCKVICALAYIPILFFLPLVACPKDSKFAKFHANQGLIMLLLSIFCNIVGSLIGLIPFIGWLVWLVLELLVLGAFLFGLINTRQGKAKELPFIGGIKIVS